MLKYTATVYIDRDDEHGDTARVVVNGATYREPHHWSDTLRQHARRAVAHLFAVDAVTGAEHDVKRTVPAGAVAVLRVTAAA